MSDHVETMDDFKAELEASFRKLKEGDIVTATVIAVSEEEATLDLKYFAPGIIRAQDLSDDPDFAIMEELHPGDELQAVIVCLDDGNGNILLSQKEANEVLGWEKLQEAQENETTYQVKIKGAVNAGAIAYIEGIRAFIPASQLSLEYVEDTTEWIGKTVDVRIITVDKENKKLVASAKVILREREEENKNHKISMLVPGSIVNGTVESLTDYGAFLNIGNGLTGLVHISQISERRIRKPSEVLEIGQKVKAKILNTNNNRIALSIRALQEEMVDTEKDEIEDLSKYTSHESASTSLGDLLKNIKLD